MQEKSKASGARLINASVPAATHEVMYAAREETSLARAVPVRQLDVQHYTPLNGTTLVCTES
jgi:hypothetical protein